MADATRPCATCGTQLDGEARFCPNCGRPGRSAAQAKGSLNKTILGLNGPGATASGNAPKPPAAPPGDGERGPGPDVESSTEVGVPAFDPPQGARPQERFARTMMGGVGLASQAQAGLAAALEYAPKKGRTMLGVPDAAAVSGAVRKAAAAQRPEPSRPQVLVGGEPSEAATLGGEPPEAAFSGGPPSEMAFLGGEPPEAASQGHHARLEPEREPAASAATRTAPGTGRLHAPPMHNAEVQDELRESAPVPRPPRRTAGLLYAAGLLALVLFGAAFWLWQDQPQGEVQVSVVSTDVGEAMLFRVLDAPSGSVVEFGDQEQPLKSGEARFPLAQDSLVVGDNVVPATIVYPDGESMSLRIPLHVDYRLFVDTAPLRAGKASLDVVIAASAGTRVILDGEPVELDGQGRGIRTYPVDVVETGRSGRVDHVVKYRIEPEQGAPLVGELRTKIAVTMLQLDSPGRTVVTDSASVQLAGAVARATTVTVDDAPIRVNGDGRFLHTLRLPEPGHYTPRLVARAPEKAPLAITLDVTRVEDLGAAAKAFAVDPRLSYDQIAQNPAMYKGQRVDFDGRVFNVKTEHGRGVLQMLVRDCAQGRQCSLWVTYPALSQVKNDSWVRILGTVQGQQQFRSQRDEIVTVPKVEAIFVLPARP